MWYHIWILRCFPLRNCRFGCWFRRSFNYLGWSSALCWCIRCCCRSRHVILIDELTFQFTVLIPAQDYRRVKELGCRNVDDERICRTALPNLFHARNVFIDRVEQAYYICQGQLSIVYEHVTYTTQIWK